MKLTLKTIKDKTDLAHIYMIDGALRSAARIYAKLADDLNKAADNKDKALDKLIAGKGGRG